MKNNLQLLKLMLPYLQPYWKQIVFVLCILPLGSISYSIQPVILQKAIDGPILSSDLDGLWVFVLALAGIVALNFLIQVMQFWLMNSIGQNMIASMREDLFAHLQKLSMRFFDRTPVGRSVSRLTSDMEQLSESFAGGLILVALDLCNIIGILLFMFYLNWQLALVVFLFLLPVYFVAINYQGLYRKANLKARKELSKLNSFLQQNVVGISVVQVLNSTSKSMQKFAENNAKYFKANDQSIKADAQLSAIIEMLSFFAIASLIFLSKNILLSGALSIGIVLAFIQYTQSLFEPIRNLSDRFTIIQSAFTALERVKQLEDEPIDLKDGELELGDLEQEPLIEFNNINFRYLPDSDLVLKDFSLELKQGEKLAIVGKTGSGKSTIIKLLTRLYEAESGEIKINGIDIKELQKESLASKIAVIPQDAYIFAGSLEENISLGRANINMDIANEFLKLAPGLKQDVQLSQRAQNISAGEEQVINFARALVREPEILILDEATAKIDIKTEAKIQSLLWKYLQNKTAIIIAHRLETIKNCQRVIDLN